MEQKEMENPGVRISIDSRGDELSEVFANFLKNRDLRIELSPATLRDLQKEAADVMFKGNDSYIELSSKGTTISGGKFEVTIQVFY